jgi:3-oxoadipate enol-lactonase / 4-carboxymuconolactone decarboxylase
VTSVMGFRRDGPDADPSSARPVVVLLNSIGTTSAMWDPVVGRLAEQVDVLRVDTRGHGLSAPAAVGPRCTVGDLGLDVLALLDELEIGRAHVAGCSLGGMVGMWLAAHRPDRVARLAVLCTSAGPLDQGAYEARAETVRREGMAAVADEVVGRWLTAATRERDPRLVEDLIAMVTSIDAESYAQCCEALAQVDLLAVLPRISAPTLVMTAEEDEALPPEHGQRIAAAVDGARLESVGAAGHVATYEQGGRIAALLLEHFMAGATLTGGLTTRREVLGEEHVERALRAASTQTRPFQEFITRYAWGEVWSRPQLSRRDRSLVTLTCLVALGVEHELPMHATAARRHGLTDEEISEAVLHSAVYVGLPRANRALAIVAETLGWSPP